jgi:hypothetical protein
MQGLRITIGTTVPIPVQFAKVSRHRVNKLTMAAGVHLSAAKGGSSMKRNYRSAKTGRFVTAVTAKKRPTSTVSEAARMKRVKSRRQSPVRAV